ncbi:hypothetical protein BYT27DRAFT_6750120 [Phlegmacium glaucopus]|nr:hypothetical protein BYT27DRAFT_6750120 [Phlegmacium glaucopus]
MHFIVLSSSLRHQQLIIQLSASFLLFHISLSARLYPYPYQICFNNPVYSYLPLSLKHASTHALSTHRTLTLNLFSVLHICSSIAPFFYTYTGLFFLSYHTETSHAFHRPVLYSYMLFSTPFHLSLLSLSWSFFWDGLVPFCCIIGLSSLMLVVLPSILTLSFLSPFPLYFHLSILSCIRSYLSFLYFLSNKNP